jgi:hypothetical protein
MPVGTRNTSSEQKAANFAAYQEMVKKKLEKKLEALRAKQPSSPEIDELSSLLSRVSMSSSVDDLDDLMKGLSMGGRRRTRKHKGKKRGGNDRADTIARCREEVKELEEAVDRLRRQRRGGTRKTRKTRRGGVDEIREEKEAKELAAKLAALKNDPTATPAQIAAAEKEYQKADNIARMLKRMQGSERFRSY